MRKQHDNGCLWWKDWHSCSCGYLEEELRKHEKILADLINQEMKKVIESEICSQVIPGTFIMCGEGFGNERQYCSNYCFNKAKGK